MRLQGSGVVVVPVCPSEAEVLIEELKVFLFGLRKGGYVIQLVTFVFLCEQ